MYCTNCGEQLREGARFCHACGAEQPDREKINNSLPSEEENLQSNPGAEEKGQVEHEQNPSLIENGTLGNENNPNEDILNPVHQDYNYSQDGQEPYTTEADKRLDALKHFVGNKFTYYFRKWDIESGEVRNVSWNWAAFFLGMFWAGYRKMYGVLFINILIWLLIDGVLLAVGLGEMESLSTVIGVSTSVVYGFWGNYFYYLFANKKIEKNRGIDGEYSEQLLRLNGGTSGLGIFISIVSMIGYIMVAVTIYLIANYQAIFGTESFFSDEYSESDDFLNDLFNSGQVEFGYGESDGYIVDPSNEFSPDDYIYFSFDFPDGIGGGYSVVIEKVEGTNYIYDSWDDSVPPDWPGVVTSIYAPVDEGEYILKIIRDQEVIANGTFYIVTGFSDTEDF